MLKEPEKLLQPVLPVTRLSSIKKLRNGILPVAVSDGRAGIKFHLPLMELPGCGE